MADLTPQTVIRRGSAHVETRVAGQTMMMSIEQGKYYALEGTAQRIWELIETPRSLADITDRLVAEYTVERAVCAAEVRDFVGELMDNGLVVRADNAAAG